MGYKVRKEWLPSSKYALKAPYAMKPKYFTIHNTWNDASAANEANYMTNNDDATSFHSVVDDKEVVELIQPNRNAWHAGDGANGTGNRESYSLEICYSKSGGRRYKEAEANGIEYTARKLIELGLTPDKVRFHKEWSGKNCPHRILDERRGAAFKSAIAKRYNELKNPVLKPSTRPVIKPPAATVKIGSLITKKDVHAYARPEWGTQTGAIVEKGQIRHVYAKKNGWYQLFSGEWLPAQSGENFDYMPVKMPEPTTVKPKHKLKRVVVDGKQVGAFSADEGIVLSVSDALKKNAKKINVEEI